MGHRFTDKEMDTLIDSMRASGIITANRSWDELQNIAAAMVDYARTSIEEILDGVTDDRINVALDEDYKKAGINAFFGNGYKMAITWIKHELLKR